MHEIIPIQTSVLVDRSIHCLKSRRVKDGLDLTLPQSLRLRMRTPWKSCRSHPNNVDKTSSDSSSQNGRFDVAVNVLRIFVILTNEAGIRRSRKKHGQGELPQRVNSLSP